MTTALPWIISALGTAYSANRANKANQQTGDLYKQQQALAKPAAAAGAQYLNQSQQAMGPSLGYYTSMLANPREATAPEQNRIGGLYAGQTANVRNQFQRGMYGPSAAQSIRDKSNAAQENVIQNARPQAAQSLAGMGANLGSLGMQGYGLGAGILGNVFNQGLAARNQSFNQGSQVGSGLFNAYQSYMMNNAMNNSNNPGSTSSEGFGGPQSTMPGLNTGAGGSSFVPPNSGSSGSPPPTPPDWSPGQ